MKFFNAIKNLFSKDIKIKQDISQYLIYPIKLKRKKVWLNSKIEVPENFVFVITHKKRILDFLPSGNHVLNSLTLPDCTKKFRLNKLDKYGKQKKNFNAMALLLNTSQQNNFTFSVKRKLKYKTSIDGKFWVKPSCNINFYIKNHTRFLKALFKNNESAQVVRKSKYVNGILKHLLGTNLYKLLKKDNYLISSFKQNKNHLENSLLPKFNKVVSRYGINVDELQISDVIFSKSAIAVEELREKLALENENISEIQPIFQTETVFNETLTFEDRETAFTDIFWSAGKTKTTPEMISSQNQEIKPIINSESSIETFQSDHDEFNLLTTVNKNESTAINNLMNFAELNQNVKTNNLITETNQNTQIKNWVDFSETNHDIKTRNLEHDMSHDSNLKYLDLKNNFSVANNLQPTQPKTDVERTFNMSIDNQPTKSNLKEKTEISKVDSSIGNFKLQNQDFKNSNPDFLRDFTSSNESSTLSQTSHENLANASNFNIKSNVNPTNNATWQGLESYGIGQVIETNSHNKNNANISPYLAKSKPRRFVQLLEH